MSQLLTSATPLTAALAARLQEISSVSTPLTAILQEQVNELASTLRGCIRVRIAAETRLPVTLEQPWPYDQAEQIIGIGVVNERPALETDRGRLVPLSALNVQMLLLLHGQVEAKAYFSAGSSGLTCHQLPLASPARAVA